MIKLLLFLDRAHLRSKFVHFSHNLSLAVSDHLNFLGEIPLLLKTFREFPLSDHSVPDPLRDLVNQFFNFVLLPFDEDVVCLKVLELLLVESVLKMAGHEADLIVYEVLGCYDFAPHSTAGLCLELGLCSGCF